MFISPFLDESPRDLDDVRGFERWKSFAFAVRVKLAQKGSALVHCGQRFQIYRLNKNEVNALKLNENIVAQTELH